MAVLPGASSFEMSITSGKFDADIFSMANATEYAENTEYAMPVAERYDLNFNKQIILLHTPIKDSISIRGLEETSDEVPGDGTFTVNYEYEGGALVTFNAEYPGTNVEVIYDYMKTVQEAIIDNKSSAIGEASLIWPVYGSGDDCTESAIIGYYVVKVFRARITTQPGMDTSYKTAATLSESCRVA